MQKPILLLLFFSDFMYPNVESSCMAPLTDSLSVFKETKSATMNIFRFFFYFLFKSFVKVELSYVFTINLFTIAENCMEK